MPPVIFNKRGDFRNSHSPIRSNGFRRNSRRFIPGSAGKILVLPANFRNSFNQIFVSRHVFTALIKQYPRWNRGHPNSLFVTKGSSTMRNTWHVRNTSLLISRIKFRNTNLLYEFLCIGFYTCQIISVPINIKPC